MILISSGSELALAVQTLETHARAVIPTRAVSMPSWDLFEERTTAYKGEVLRLAIGARVAVEQAATMGWQRYLGRLGAVIGMHSFGASALLKLLLTQFGFTPERLPEVAKEQIARHVGVKDVKQAAE